MSLKVLLAKCCLLVILCLCSYTIMYCQEYRTYTGSDNNLTHPEWNSVGNELAYITGNGFIDGIEAPGGISRPNPRFISNSLFDQDGILANSKTLSEYIWVFGQFIDHDISIVEDDASSFMPISVPGGDQYFDENSIIPMSRSLAVSGTGTSQENFRKVANAISGWIDASSVYGSDQYRANWLRTFIGGKMKMSIGDLPPFNTLSGELESGIDAQAPVMANPTNISRKYFVVGDIRGNENLLLTSFHTLFLREHNRLCTIAQESKPHWTDEEIYQFARRRVGATIQSITYNEWLPAMGIDLNNYSGYDDSVDPRISNIFSAAAFRWGHSLVGSEIVRMDNNGDILSVGNISLKNAFFNPLALIESQGIEPLLKGMGTKMHQEMDCKVVSNIRNFLFGEPASGGLDLVAINIMRGRERGLRDFNGIREDLGLETYLTWDEFVEDPTVARQMESLYENINDVDPWVGMLAENHMPQALFGETIMTIMQEQFTKLRDGDRFYFENDSDISDIDKEEIKSTRMYDILKKNTDIKLMQENVFLAQPHSNIVGSNVAVLEKNLDFRTFPNPVDEVLYFKVFLDAASDLIVEIRDNVGRLILSEEKVGVIGRNIIEMDGLSSLIGPGLYYIGVADGETVGYQNFIKH